jgi:hypothetical protein
MDVISKPVAGVTGRSYVVSERRACLPPLADPGCRLSCPLGPNDQQKTKQ